MKKFTLVWILILSTQIFAQTEFGSISGEVTDPNGAVIPNAKVKIIPIVNGKYFDENAKLSFTNNDGFFSFDNLSTGLYEVQIKVSWTEITVKKQIKVVKNDSTKINAQFKSYVIEGCSDIIDIKDLTTSEDKAKIVNDILKEAKIPYKSAPILSTKNIKSNWLTSENKHRFKLMSQSAIQHRADTQGDFEYFSFQKIKVKGNCVEISFSYFFAKGKNSKVVYMSGEGSTYEFRKVDAKLIKRFVTGWIS